MGTLPKFKLPIYLYPWAIIVFIFSQAYRLTLLTFFNISFNGYYLIKMLITGKLFKTIKKAKKDLAKINSIVNLFKEYEKFKYTYDGICTNAKGFWKNLNKWPTWTSCYLVLNYLDLKGNCQDSCILARKYIKAYNKYLKNTKIKEKIKIYVPLNIKALFKSVHYINKVDIDNKSYSFSNGVIRLEDINEVPKRLISKKSKYYMWIQ